MTKIMVQPVPHGYRGSMIGVPGARGAVPEFDFSTTPFTVIWEVTRACDLRCVHCRASAQPFRHPLELSTNEGYALLDEIRALGSPVFVITGGDPLKRDDLFDLIAYGAQRGLAVSVTPSGTGLLAATAVQRMADHGVKRIALSLDGADAPTHDQLRQQPGSFEWTVRGARAAVDRGIPIQINTTVTRRNLPQLEAIVATVTGLSPVMWSVFFLVTVGRAQAADQLSSGEYERVFAFLYDLSSRVPFAVRTTAAPHYRRFVLQRERERRRAGHAAAIPLRLAGMTGSVPRPHRGVTDGNGLVFISHTGDVYPSGFLPIRIGNVRQAPLAELYRTAPLLRQLRDPEALEGKCGRCEFRYVCGGSRARAFASTGNPLAEEPLCIYEPVRIVDLGLGLQCRDSGCGCEGGDDDDESNLPTARPHAVRIVWEPPWHPRKMSAAARAQLRETT
jgi:radical SAM protein